MAHATPGCFLWYDLLSKDTKEASVFYTQVIGWTAQPFEQGYTLFSGSQGGVGGTIDMPEHARNTGTPPHWTANVCVADVDATVADVRKLGGRVLVEPNDFPKVGRLAVIADPQGASINLFKPQDPQGMTLHDSKRPGEFTWSELVSSEHESAFAFYAKLFGWERTRDFDLGAMGKYLIYGLDGKDLGGMFTKPKDMPAPPHWLYYIETSGLNDTIDRATSKGARVLNGPEEVPGGARIAQLMDPQGAVFGLHEAAKKA
jgi:predicted enzyme related to lactoylglutathione lyase